MVWRGSKHYAMGKSRSKTIFKVIFLNLRVFTMHINIKPEKYPNLNFHALPYFLSMFEAKAREYFQGACHRFLVPATEVPEAGQLVISMELLAISSMSEVRSVYKVCCRASLRLPEGF